MDKRQRRCVLRGREVVDGREIGTEGYSGRINLIGTPAITPPDSCSPQHLGLQQGYKVLRKSAH
jgi:hypothetical protein